MRIDSPASAGTHDSLEARLEGSNSVTHPSIGNYVSNYFSNTVNSVIIQMYIYGIMVNICILGYILIVFRNSLTSDLSQESHQSRTSNSYFVWLGLPHLSRGYP